MHTEEAREFIKRLTGKAYVVFTTRGNQSILEALRHHKEKKKVLTQDQGGWITYTQAIKKLKMQEVRLITEHGAADRTFKAQIRDHPDSVLLWNSMPAYAACDDTRMIHEECRKNNITFINDVSGSIGTDHAKHGDVIIGSFGKNKPIDVGEGGFIASNTPINTAETPPHHSLMDKLKNLEHRLAMYERERAKVIKDLNHYRIVHKDRKGINVIVLFDSDKERDALIKYCQDHHLEFTLCPRYIRVNQKAVSIEIKRKA
ncbi:MAG: hypothetical protein ABIH41_02770 [Nanoarchaeota archaeon]